jgi:hypothetical protein
VHCTSIIASTTNLTLLHPEQYVEFEHQDLGREKWGSGRLSERTAPKSQVTHFVVSDVTTDQEYRD